MRRRIREAIVGVSAAILLVLGLPLAVVVQRLILNAEVVQLQGEATRTLAEVAVPLDLGQLEAVRTEGDAPPPFTVYDAAGRRVFGPGPATADALVRRALRGNPARSTEERIEVTVPITDRSADEQIIGAVRVTESLRRADTRTRLAWLLMAGSAAAALFVAWLVGGRLARRLAAPIAELAIEAERIGDGGTLVAPPPSGIVEIDRLAAVLADSTGRVSEALARERRFSGDVSHQLRTPLTALRLRLEAAEDDGDTGALAPALADLARLEETVTHLLAVARDSMPSVTSARPLTAVHAARDRWQGPVAAAGRALTVSGEETGPVRGSATSIAQVLDVLVDNALRHGAGTIAIRTRPLPGGVAIDVADEGAGIAMADSTRIFERGHGAGHGIGLALARSLTEAEGGRLVLAGLHPTTFSLVLVDHDPDRGADRR